MNTITMSRSDWYIVDFVMNKFIHENNLQGGSVDVILSNINLQLDGQEY